MKKSSFFAGMLTMLLILCLGGTAFAAAYQKQATLNYQGIKITLDGEEITPKDGAGNVVEPFTIDGTTYLPVRAVANALGLEVGWDGATNTVILTTPEDEWAAYDVRDCYARFSVPSLENIVGPAAIPDIYFLETGDGVLYTYDPEKFNVSEGQDFEKEYFSLLEDYGFLLQGERGGVVTYKGAISDITVAVYWEEQYGNFCVLLMNLPEGVS